MRERERKTQREREYFENDCVHMCISVLLCKPGD